MNDGTCGSSRFAAWFIGAAGTLLLVGGLAWFIVQRTRPPGVDLVRAQLRAQYLAEVRAEAQKGLTTYEEIDKARGIWRVPEQRALEMALPLLQNAAAGRSNLLSRIDKATAKLPEKPNEYE